MAISWNLRYNKRIMANLFDRERNKRTQAKKDRAAEKKASKSNDAVSGMGEETELLYEIGILADIHSKRFEIMQDHELFSAVLDREVCLNEESDFAVGDRVFS